MDDPPPPYLETDPHATATAVNSHVPITNSFAPAAPGYAAGPAARGRDELTTLRESSTEYFQTHPAPDSQSAAETICHTMIAPLEGSESIPFPQDRLWAQHGVRQDDWFTFVNHLYPASTRSMGDKKSQPAEDPRKTKQRIFAITSYWNAGFFEPRGIMIIPEMVDSSARSARQPDPAPPATPAIPAPVSPAPSPPAQPFTKTVISPEERAELDARAAMLIESHKDRAIYQAVKKHDTQLVRVLLDKGQSPNSKSWGEEPPLQVAVSNNDTEIADMLLDAKGIQVDNKMFCGETALYKAVSMNNAYLVRRLLAKGASPEKHVTGCDTMLFRAASRNYMDIAQALLEAGAKVDSTTMGRGTALYACVSEGNIAMAELLLDHGANVDVYPMGQTFMVQVAASNKNNALVKLLVAHGANLDKKYNSGTTALDDVVTNGDTYAAEILLKNGANPNIVTSWGKTALDIAIEHYNKKMITILVQNGADVERKPRSSEHSIIYNIATKKDISLLRILLEHGAGGDRQGLTSRLRARASAKNNIDALETLEAAEKPSVLSSISWLWGK